MNLLMNFEPSRNHTESVPVLVCDSDALKKILMKLLTAGPSGDDFYSTHVVME